MRTRVYGSWLSLLSKLSLNHSLHILHSRRPESIPPTVSENCYLCCPSNIHDHTPPPFPPHPSTPNPVCCVLADDATLAAVHRGWVLGVEVFGLFVLVTVHEAEHARPRLVGQRIWLEVGLESGREGKVVDAIYGGLWDDRATRQLLQAQHWKWEQRQRCWCYTCIMHQTGQFPS